MKTKKTFPFIGVFAAFMVALASASCMRETPELPVSSLPSDAITFGVDGSFRAEVQTKATEVTSLSSFYVTAVTGSAGSESQAWNSVQFSQVPGSSPATYAGNKYWPASNPGYKFYGSNVTLNFAAGGTYVNASNATDVVCAYLDSPTYNTKNTLSFEHIFARLCRVDVAAQTGYTISNIQMYITPKTGGTYNLRTKEWSSVATGSATLISNKTGATNNDIFCVPGVYSITASWVATDASGASVTHTNEVCNVPLLAGKTNNISCVLGGDITFGVDLQDYADYDYRDNLDYLTFYCDEAGTIGWQCFAPDISRTIQYSKDFGATWTDLTSTTDGATVAVNAGDIVWFKGSNTEYGTGNYMSFFVLSNKTHVYGNVNSLTGNNTSVSSYCFNYLFWGCNNLYTYEHKKIILPATTLGEYCYFGIFMGCSSLTTPPELPATTLASSCYGSMFSDCSSLTSAPRLPATTLASSCYSNMFCGCTSLTTAPELPATTLSETCYGFMFYNCSSLTTALELPATTLASSCYQYMFWDCTSLTTAPALPASTLAVSCYEDMFKGCTSLTTAPELPATTLASGCYNNMFLNCTSLTTAPELPATTLASQCYSSMFAGCSSLTTAPELPATTLVSQCYNGMFQNCTSLNYIKAFFTTTPSSSYTDNWVNGVAPTGTFVKSAAATWNETGNNGVPTGWTVKVETPGPGRWMDNPDNYLRFKFVTDGQVAWQKMKGDIQYSKNGGAWTAFNGATVSMSAGDEIWFKGDLTGGVGAFSPSYSSKFSTVGEFYVSGNVQSLCSFNNTLQQYHFGYLFSDSTGLNIDVSTPLSLPATTLTNWCYFNMFYGCSSLTTAPELPATTLVSSCYTNMFYGCISLTTAPELPATTLASGCYNNMFMNCTSLTTAPELPATTLASNCYSSMFAGCSSLTTAPELPATTLVSQCYNGMFQNCTSLNYIKAFFTTTPSSSYTNDWVSGVAPTGTFVKSTAATWNVTGNSGVPTGWTAMTEREAYLANGHAFVDLGLRVDGKKILFATCNIGADSPEEYGDYFAWGETSKRYTSISEDSVVGGSFEWSNCPYHTGDDSSTGWSKYIPTGNEDHTVSGTADNKLILDASDDVASVLWGGSWRMPDYSDLEYLISDDVTYSWTDDYNDTGVGGYLVTGKGSFSSASLFLPAAGYCNDTVLYNAGYYGYYWSRSVFSGLSSAWYLYFHDGDGYSMFSTYRCYGLSVRPVLVIPE